MAETYKPHISEWCRSLHTFPRRKRPEKTYQKEAHCDKVCPFPCAIPYGGLYATAGGTQGIGRYAPPVGRQAHTLYERSPPLRRGKGISLASPKEMRRPSRMCAFGVKYPKLMNLLPLLRKVGADLISTAFSCLQSGHPCHAQGPFL